MSLEGACRREWLEEAFRWCCRQRKNAPADADIWHLWFHWQEIKPELLAQLEGNRYRLSAMQVVGRGKDRLAMWSAQDALVLKWVAIRLHAVLPVHPLCEHHRGHGGGQQSVRRMDKSLREQRWSYVCRTDIQGFYGHIRRGPLLRQLKRHVSDPVLLELVRQYLHYSVERGGEFYTPRKGLCRGCALSPLLAGFCLWAMDTYFEAQQPALRYVRYMDDIVIFTRTRWLLRRAVRALNVFFASGGYRQHPQKTFIGKAERGFDWMGIQFNGSGIVGVAPRAMANHRERCRRPYEQAWRYGERETRKRVAAYVRRWTIWRKTMHIMQRATDVQPDGTRAGRITSMLATAGHRGQAPAGTYTSAGQSVDQSNTLHHTLSKLICGVAILAFLGVPSHAATSTFTTRQAPDGSVNASHFKALTMIGLTSPVVSTGQTMTFDVLDGEGTPLGAADGYCLYRDRPLVGIRMGIDTCPGGLRVGYPGNWGTGLQFLLGNDTAAQSSTGSYVLNTGLNALHADASIPASAGGTFNPKGGIPTTLTLPNNIPGVQGGALRLLPRPSSPGYQAGAKVQAAPSDGVVPGTYSGTLSYVVDGVVVDTATLTVTLLPAVPTCTVTPAVTVDLGRVAQAAMPTGPNQLLAVRGVTTHVNCRAASATDVGKFIDVQFQGATDAGSEYHLALTNTTGATADAPYIVMSVGAASDPAQICTIHKPYTGNNPLVSWAGLTSPPVNTGSNYVYTNLGDNNADFKYTAYLCNPSSGQAAVGQYRGTATYQASLQ